MTTSGGVVDNDSGGMLALTSNMGTYTQNEMAVIPELGVTLGFDVTKRWPGDVRFTRSSIGATWRGPADQIDRNLNPTYFANNGPTAGAVQPEFSFITSDFWTQGMNFGLELHF